MKAESWERADEVRKEIQDLLTELIVAPIGKQIAKLPQNAALDRAFEDLTLELKDEVSRLRGASSGMAKEIEHSIERHFVSLDGKLDQLQSTADSAVSGLKTLKVLREQQLKVEQMLIRAQKLDTAITIAGFVALAVLLLAVS